MHLTSNIFFTYSKHILPFSLWNFSFNAPYNLTKPDIIWPMNKPVRGMGLSLRWRQKLLCNAKILCDVWVSVVLRRTVLKGDIDWHFDNLSGSHHQSQVICVMSVGGINTLVIVVIRQQSRNVIGRLSVKPSCHWLWRLYTVIGAFQSIWIIQ